MQTFQGKVVSTGMQKTAIVLVRRRFQHPFYQKSMTSTKKYHVHDELGVHEGDEVKFVGCKPISKTKKWKIIEVVSSTADVGTTAAAEKPAVIEKKESAIKKKATTKQGDKTSAKKATKESRAKKKPTTKK